MNRKSAHVPIALVMAAGLLAGCTTSHRSTSRVSSPAPTAASASVPQARTDTARPLADVNGELTSQQVVKQLTPSVVRVSAGATQTNFFGQSIQQNGTGTGVILDADGHILTNNHVVTLDGQQAANNLKVVLADGRSLDAKVVGQDSRTDLAVVQVDAKNLTPAKFAPSGTTEVGEPVLAIGYALNISGTPTVTSGVVSALDRTIPENTTAIPGAIQTDAPINPGNSGGPLLNLRGEVIGINTAGRSDAQGIFFAISSDVAQPVVRDLIGKGKVDRGYLGITTVSVTPEVAQSKSLPVANGVLIDSVQSATPADKAGLKQGDVIVKIGNYDVHNTGDLQNALAENPPNSKVAVDYYRGKDKKSTDVTLGTRPDNLG
ncbi:MAG: S1C family serine protease [Dehalococcoidia bacterium]